MRLMIVGSDRIYAIENFYVKYLREQGVEVFHFPAQSIFYDYYQAGILNKLFYRAGLSGILKKINRLFLQAVENFKPDVIWVFKGMEIFPGSLEKVKEQAVKLVNFNGDSPFVFSGAGSGNSNITKSTWLYDLHFTYNESIKQEMENRFGIPTEILPFGFDIDEETFQLCCALPEVNRVCFMGNPDVFRGEFLQQLAERNVPLDLYGNDWERFVKHPGVQIFGPLYAAEGWKVLRKYRVQLNLMRPHNPESHNMRTFELGGVGAIQLAQDTPDHRSNFTAGEEIFLFTDVKDCHTKLQELLAMDAPAAKIIREKARKRSFDSGYYYQARAQHALQKIKTILG